MTDEETAARLKARVDRWQTYIQQSRTLNASESGESGESAAAAPANLHWLGTAAEVTDAAVPTPVLPTANLPIYLGPAGQQDYLGTTAPRDSTLSETEADAAVWEARVAELREAVEHEREQARRLADTVTRQQVLHAMSLQTQASLHAQQQGQGRPGAAAATSAAAAEPRAAATASPRPHPSSSAAAGFAVSNGIRREAARARPDTSRQSVVASLLFFVFLCGFLIFALLNW